MLVSVQRPDQASKCKKIQPQKMRLDFLYAYFSTEQSVHKEGDVFYVLIRIREGSAQALRQSGIGHERNT